MPTLIAALFFAVMSGVGVSWATKDPNWGFATTFFVLALGFFMYAAAHIIAAA